MRREALRATYLVKGIIVPFQVQKILDGLYFDIESFNIDLGLLE